jgi:methyl coenzyme M reductase subunit D
MPFSLHTSLSHFQRTIISILGSIIRRGVRVYLGDVVIYANSEADHIEIITEVIKRLNKFGLKGQEKKCEFFRRKFNITVTGTENATPGRQKINLTISLMLNYCPHPNS